MSETIDRAAPGERKPGRPTNTLRSGRGDVHRRRPLALRGLWKKALQTPISHRMKELIAALVGRKEQLDAQI